LFAVDATPVDGVTGGHLRPDARTLLELLRDCGVRVLLWSSGGADFALRRDRQDAIDHLVDAAYGKPGTCRPSFTTPRPASSWTTSPRRSRPWEPPSPRVQGRRGTLPLAASLGDSSGADNGV
jgi:hypothetical protein